MKCNATEKGMNEDEECFEGFAYDLLAEMAKFNKFKFKFTTNEDYGTLNHKTGKWNGMIGELQSMVRHNKRPRLHDTYIHGDIFKNYLI